MPIISISLSEGMLREIDKLKEELGFPLVQSFCVLVRGC